MLFLFNHLIKRRLFNWYDFDIYLNNETISSIITIKIEISKSIVYFNFKERRSG